MKSMLIMLAAATAVLAVRAERHLDFGVDSILSAIPEGVVRSTVFSPFAAETDLAILSEGQETIQKSRYVEALGALAGYDEMLLPVSSMYRNCDTNAFRLLSARAMIAPELRMLNTAYRNSVRETFKVEFCPAVMGGKGAECWLHAAMDGVAEDFRLPAEVVASSSFSLVDLEEFSVRWETSFLGVGEDYDVMPFKTVDGRERSVRVMHSVRPGGGVWENRRFTLLELPMAGEMWFYAMLPAEGVSLPEVRKQLTSDTIEQLLVITSSLTESGVVKGPVEAWIPLMDIVSKVDLIPVIRRYGLTTANFLPFSAPDDPAAIFQRVRFKLDGDGQLPRQVESRSVKTVRLDHPFVFFVLHRPTKSIPVAGVYGGE